MAEAVTKLPIKTEGQEPGPGEWRPLAIPRREIDRLFDDFGWGMMRRPARTPFNVEPFWRGELSFGKAPAVDIAENEKEYELTAELPGLDENNVEVIAMNPRCAPKWVFPYSFAGSDLAGHDQSSAALPYDAISNAKTF